MRPGSAPLRGDLGRVPGPIWACFSLSTLKVLVLTVFGL